MISNFIIQALKNEPITVYGKGTQTRSFCYVTDMIDALVKLMESNFIGPVNLGNPEEYKIIELAELIIELTNSKSKIIFEALPSDDPVQREPDISLAKIKLNWEPSTPLKEGLLLTINYFDKVLSNKVNI